jgi:hypothetical protein
MKNSINNQNAALTIEALKKELEVSLKEEIKFQQYHKDIIRRQQMNGSGTTTAIH